MVTSLVHCTCLEITLTVIFHGTLKDNQEFIGLINIKNCCLNELLHFNTHAFYCAKFILAKFLAVRLICKALYIMFFIQILFETIFLVSIIVLSAFRTNNIKVGALKYVYLCTCIMFVYHVCVMFLYVIEILMSQVNLFYAHGNRNAS